MFVLLLALYVGAPSWVVGLAPCWLSGGGGQGSAGSEHDISAAGLSEAEFGMLGALSGNSSLLVGSLGGEVSNIKSGRWFGET